MDLFYVDPLKLGTSAHSSPSSFWSFVLFFKGHVIMEEFIRWILVGSILVAIVKTAGMF